jgi:hypothetical protein
METRDYNYFRNKYRGSLRLDPPDGDYEAVLVRVSPEPGYQLRLFFEIQSNMSSPLALHPGAQYIASEKFHGVRPDFRNDPRYLREAPLLEKFMRDWTGTGPDMSFHSTLTHAALMELLKRHIGRPAIVTMKARLIDFIRPAGAARGPVEEWGENPANRPGREFRPDSKPQRGSLGWTNRIPK